MVAFELDLGAGLVLRLAEARLAEPLAALVADNRERLDRWEDWAADLSEPEAARRMLLAVGTGFAAGTAVPAVPVVDGRLAGFANLRVDPGARSASVGYWIGAAFGGRGLMTRTVTALARYGFDHLGLVRVSATVAVGNTASQAVVRRAGFRREAVLRSGQVVHGRAVDAEVWSRLPGDPA